MKRSRVSWGGCVLVAVCAVATHALAQMPSDAQIQRKMEELRRAIPEQMQQAERQAGVQVRRVDPGQPQHGHIDPAIIAERYREVDRLAKERDAQRVMVFASLSMPAESLRRLARDASAAGVPIYFRGLRYGFGPGRTAQGLAELKPLVELGASVQIHPEAFRTYGVRSVPVFVVAAAADADCAGAQCREVMGRVDGDVSLAYALEALGQRRDAVGSVARATLQRMRAGGGR